MPPTPVTVLTGFLGAGKTTLLNRLLRAPGLADTAVIVNEFGDVGLDHLLVEQGQDSVVLLDAGCLCCVLADSLRETLADLYQRRARGTVPPFARVVIETSGLADPGPILESLLRDPLLAGRFVPGAVVCVVDALFGATSLDDHREAREQAAIADWLVLTKRSAAEKAQVEVLVRRLSAINPAAALVDAEAAGFDPVPLLGERLSWPEPSPGHDHQHEPDVASQVLRRTEPTSWAGIAAWTAHLAARWRGDLLRCKALLPLAGEGVPALVQGVRDRFAVTRLAAWPDDDRSGRIVAIGRELDRAALEAGLAWLDVPAGGHHPGDAGFPDPTEGTSA